MSRKICAWRCIVVALCWGTLSAPIRAQVPALMINQGRLFDGAQMVNGTVTMALRIYDDPTGGTLLYEDVGAVAVEDGYYSTFLGDNSTKGSLADALAGGEAYIDVTVDGVSYPPRELISSVAYALKADLADGVPREAITAEMIGPGAVSGSGLAEEAVAGRHLAAGAVTAEKLGSDVLDLLASLHAGSTSVSPRASSTSPMLRIEGSADVSPNIVAGHLANYASPDVRGATVGGGGDAGRPNTASGLFATVDGGLGNTGGGPYAAVGGGLDNRADGKRATVGGGRLNRALGASSAISGGFSNAAQATYGVIGGGRGNLVTGYVGTVAGGWNNQAGGAVSVVAGGQENAASGAAAALSGGWANKASGFAASIGGGQANAARGPHAVVAGGTNNLAGGEAATVPGGRHNTALGAGSLAAGTRARAAHDGSFVWSDGTGGDFASTAPGQFLVHAAGNVGIDTDSPGEKLTVGGNIAPARSGDADLGSPGARWRRLHVAGAIDADGDLAFTRGPATNLVLTADGRVLVPGVVVAARFEGDGSGLSGVPATAIRPGSISDTELSSTAAIDPQKIAGTALTGLTAFDGDVAGSWNQLTLREDAVGPAALAEGAVNTDHLAEGAITRDKLADGVVEDLRQAGTAWALAGNDASGRPDARLGTTGDQPLLIITGGQPALRIEPDERSPNLIGGYRENTAAGTAVGAVIGGGGGSDGVHRVTGNFGTVGGGLGNRAGNEYATIGGGINNSAAGSAATVAGGWNNAANDLDATVGGGQDNTAAGSASTIAGGFQNTADGDYATVPGGTENVADGAYSFAAGRSAQALHDGAVVWSDSRGEAFASTAPDQFLIRAAGNVGIDAASPDEKLTVRGNIAPAETETHTLGTAGRRWHSLYVSSHIDFQNEIRFLAGQQQKLALDRDGNLSVRGNLAAGSFVGDGSGLSGIDGSSLGAGTVYDAQISSLASINPRKIDGVALTEVTRFAGDVAGDYQSLALRDGAVDTARLADDAVTAEKLQRGAVGIHHLEDEVKLALRASSASWRLGGNQGTQAGRDAMGTTDRQPLELHVNKTRALRIEPTTGSPNLLGGDVHNAVATGVVGATISGGGSLSNPNRAQKNYGVIAGGVGNAALHEYATVSGGFGNIAEGFESTVGGGQDNRAAGSGSTISGGFTNRASGSFSTIGGGADNVVRGNVATVAGGFGNAARGAYATVPGGAGNTASGDYSLAAGRGAQARHPGTFVWADSADAAFASHAPDQFLVRARGGVGINVENPVHPLQLGGGAYSTGAQWVNASDRNAKENFEELDDAELLARLDALPITAWNYRADDRSVRHVGPTAQDFFQAFALGDSDTSIYTGDASGIALAAVKALHRQNQELKRENQALRDSIESLTTRFQQIQRALADGRIEEPR